MREMKFSEEWISMLVPVQKQDRAEVQPGCITHYTIQCCGWESEHQSVVPEQRERAVAKKFSATILYRLASGEKKSKTDKQTLPLILKVKSSGLNDNSSSLGSDCCYSNFFLFFSIYAPYARWYEVKYCIYARSRHTYWGLIIAGGWRKCSDSRTGAEGRKAQVVHSN